MWGLACTHVIRVHMHETGSFISEQKCGKIWDKGCGAWKIFRYDKKIIIKW